MATLDSILEGSELSFLTVYWRALHVSWKDMAARVGNIPVYRDQRFSDRSFDSSEQPSSTGRHWCNNVPRWWGEVEQARGRMPDLVCIVDERNVQPNSCGKARAVVVSTCA